MKLTHTIPLGAGETPTSFTSRLGALYGTSAREFCLDWDVHFQAVVYGEEAAITKIADLAGVASAALMADAFVSTDVAKRRWHYRGQHLVRSALCRGRMRVCPQCLTDDIQARPDLPRALAIYGRASWLVEAIRTCPHHRIGLIDIGDYRSPDNLHDFAAHATPAIVHLDKLIAAAPRRGPSDLEQYMLGRLHGATQSPFLDGLELHAAIRSCETIGAVALFGRRVTLRRLSDDDWHRAGGAGFKIVGGGVPSIGEFLAELQRTYPYGRLGNEGPQALYGKIYHWLAFWDDDPAYDPIREVIGDHIRSHLPVGPGDIVFGKPVKERTLHSIRTLSVETGMHPKRLRKLLQAVGMVQADQMTRTDNLVVLEAQAAARLVSRVKGAISRPTAGKRFNIPRVQMDILVRSGILTPCVPVSAGVIDRYAPADIEAFLRRLLAGARTVRTPTRNQKSIAKAARSACCTSTEVVRLILDGKLNWVGRLAGKRGYMSILVDSEEIRANTKGPGHGGVTKGQMCKRLHTQAHVVRGLIEIGALRTFVAQNAENRCPLVVIRADDADQFERDFVSLVQLEKERGKSAWRLLKAFNAAGVTPAFDRDVVGARFYRRSAVNKISD